MRILQACPYSWDARGGVQSHVRHLGQALRTRGHRVLTIAPGRRQAAAGSDVRRLGGTVRVPFNGSIAPVSLDPRVLGSIRRIIREFQPDVLHVHEPYASMTGAAALMTRAPTVISFHAAIERRLDRFAYGALAAALRPLGFDFAECVAVSSPAARTARLCAGREPVIVPNGTDFDGLSRATPAALPPGRRMLFLGRLEPRKGLAVALEAFAELAAARPDVWFVIAGDGPQRGLIARVPDALRTRVLVLGDCSPDRVPSLYAAADVFVAPATGSESFGMALLDAMAAGTPVVASDNDGYRELVDHGATGLLVPPGDAHALEAAVASLLDDPAGARVLGECARQRARHYAWPDIALRIERIYERVCR